MSLLILTKLKYRTIALGLGIVPMVLTYPICKRHTHFAQLVLGLAFNWGAVLGWSQSCSDSLIDLSKLLPLYIGSVLWTVMYDTVYGFQDIKYDKVLNLKSMAILTQKYYRPALQFLNFSFVSCLLAASYKSSLLFFMPTSIILSGILNSIWLSRLDFASPMMCGKFFRKNGLIGLTIFAGSLLDKLFKF